MAVAAIELGDLGPHEREVEDLGHTAQRMVGAQAVLEMDPVTEQRLLRLVKAHPTEDRIPTDPLLFKLFLGK